MKTVLYIDDSPDDLLLFHRACDCVQVSFDLRLVETGSAAVRYLNGTGEYADQAHPVPDIILLDIKMPEMDGFEVLNWIRAHPRFSQIMVALYSSSMVNKDVLRGYLGGTTFYIPKPHATSKLAELARALDECIRSDLKDCARLLQFSIGRSQV